MIINIDSTLYPNQFKQNITQMQHIFKWLLAFANFNKVPETFTVSLGSQTSEAKSERIVLGTHISQDPNTLSRRGVRTVAKVW